MTGQDWFILGFAAFLFLAFMAIPLLAATPDAETQDEVDAR